MMALIILSTILGGLIFAHHRLASTFVSGQTALTGAWLLSLALLYGSEESWEYITLEAAFYIALVHITFFIGSAISRTFSRKKPARTVIAELHGDSRSLRALVLLFWAFLIPGLVGAWSLLGATGALLALGTADLYHVRDDVLSLNIHIPLISRVMSNMLYPAALLGTINYILLRNHRLRALFLLLPLAGILMMSLSSGGRGAILIAGTLAFWAFLIPTAVPRSRQNRRRLFFVLIAAVVTIGGYIAYIATLRGDQEGFGAFESIYIYLIGPIPSFSTWMVLNQFPIISFDLSSLAFVRETLRAFGIDASRNVGDQLVYVPFGFNVFTSLAEHLMSFGLLGTLGLWFSLGIWTGSIENGQRSIKNHSIRACTYAYLSFTIFADLSFFVVGWWLALAALPFGMPIAKSMVGTLKRR